MLLPGEIRAGIRTKPEKKILSCCWLKNSLKCVVRNNNMITIIMVMSHVLLLLNVAECRYRSIGFNESRHRAIPAE